MMTAKACVMGVAFGMLAWMGASAATYPQAPYPAPPGWGDFQMGINNNDRTEWDSPMKAALNAGAKLDRRYLYITTQSDVDNVYFSSWKNYAKDAYYTGKGVRPAIVLYFVNNGVDDIDALVTNCANTTHMKAYLTTIAKIATEAKGSKPIYVIEPDLWGYMLQRQDEAGTDYLPKSCQLGSLGLSWLQGHGNTIGDLPEAIFKTIRAHDPEAYAGILMAFWGFRGNASGSQMVEFSQADVLKTADSSALFLNRLLETKDKGDFIGFEKNGSDAGWYKTQGKMTYMWTDAQNQKWLDWSQRVAQGVKLPALGWQICLGHEGLPNTKFQYEDTFFKFFFDKAQSFVDAGFIGMLAGCANRGEGTAATIDPNSGDKGYFYGRLADFDKGRPYLSATSPVRPLQANAGYALQQGASGWILTGPEGQAQVLDAKGQILHTWNHARMSTVPTPMLAPGQYILRLGAQASWAIWVD
jgi:hypothetical protein